MIHEALAQIRPVGHRGQDLWQRHGRNHQFQPGQEHADAEHRQKEVGVAPMHVASLGEGVAAERGLPASGTSPARLGQPRPQSRAGTFGPRGRFAAVPARTIDFATPVTRQPCRAAGETP